MVALINTIWTVSSATQILGKNLSEKFSRKNILTTTMIINSLSFLMLALIAFLYLKNIATQILPIFILIFVALLVSAGEISHPSWFSWMGKWWI